MVAATKAATSKSTSASRRHATIFSPGPPICCIKGIKNKEIAVS